MAYFLPSERDREFLRYVLYTPAANCFCIRRRSPRIIGRVANTVTTGWVEAPKKRVPFRIHDPVVGFIDRCLSRAGNLAASNKHLAEFSSGRSWTKICPGIIFSGFLKSLKLFFRRFVHIASGTETLWRVYLKFKLSFGDVAFPLASV